MITLGFSLSLRPWTIVFAQRSTTYYMVYFVALVGPFWRQDLILCIVSKFNIKFHIIFENKFVFVFIRFLNFIF
jgi:hypothetical protein